MRCNIKQLIAFKCIWIAQHECMIKTENAYNLPLSPVQHATGCPERP